MPVKAFTGGAALEAKLKEIAAKVKKAASVAVGFMEGSNYEDGTPIAYIALINEFGATIDVEAHSQTIYRQTNAKKTGFNKNGKFVKKRQSNFASDHDVAAHTITIPARPFFRTMIAENSPEWGGQLAKILVDSDYDAAKALDQMGESIAGELKQSIIDFNDPPNAKSTIAKKKFATPKPLIDSGLMLRAVTHKVKK